MKAKKQIGLKTSSTNRVERARQRRQSLSDMSVTGTETSSLALTQYMEKQEKQKREAEKAYAESGRSRPTSGDERLRQYAETEKMTRLEEEEKEGGDGLEEGGEGEKKVAEKEESRPSTREGYNSSYGTTDDVVAESEGDKEGGDDGEGENRENGDGGDGEEGGGDGGQAKDGVSGGKQQQQQKEQRGNIDSGRAFTSVGPTTRRASQFTPAGKYAHAPPGVVLAEVEADHRQLEAEMAVTSPDNHLVAQHAHVSGTGYLSASQQQRYEAEQQKQMHKYKRQDYHPQHDQQQDQQQDPQGVYFNPDRPIDDEDDGRAAGPKQRMLVLESMRRAEVLKGIREKAVLSRRRLQQVRETEQRRRLELTRDQVYHSWNSASRRVEMQQLRDTQSRETAMKLHEKTYTAHMRRQEQLCQRSPRLASAEHSRHFFPTHNLGNKGNRNGSNSDNDDGGRSDQILESSHSDDAGTTGTAEAVGNSSSGDVNSNDRDEQHDEPQTHQATQHDTNGAPASPAQSPVMRVKLNAGNRSTSHATSNAAPPISSPRSLMMGVGGVVVGRWNPTRHPQMQPQDYEEDDDEDYEQYRYDGAPRLELNGISLEPPPPIDFFTGQMTAGFHSNGGEGFGASSSSYHPAPSAAQSPSSAAQSPRAVRWQQQGNSFLCNYGGSSSAQGGVWRSTPLVDGHGGGNADGGEGSGGGGGKLRGGGGGGGGGRGGWGGSHHPVPTPLSFCSGRTPSRPSTVHHTGTGTYRRRSSFEAEQRGETREGRGGMTAEGGVDGRSQSARATRTCRGEIAIPTPPSSARWQQSRGSPSGGTSPRPGRSVYHQGGQPTKMQQKYHQGGQQRRQQSSQQQQQQQQQQQRRRQNHHRRQEQPQTGSGGKARFAVHVQQTRDRDQDRERDLINRDRALHVNRDRSRDRGGDCGGDRDQRGTPRGKAAAFVSHVQQKRPEAGSFQYSPRLMQQMQNLDRGRHGHGEGERAERGGEANEDPSNMTLGSRWDGDRPTELQQNSREEEERQRRERYCAQRGGAPDDEAEEEEVRPSSTSTPWSSDGRNGSA